jgi:MFS family permease
LPASIALITITVMLGMIMAILDTTIVNVAIDTIGDNLGASVDEVSWVATGYILSSVITMPLNGYLTALFGRKNFYAWCVVLFTVASFLCGTAQSIGMLVFYRVLQGFGGGALQPTAQAILFETFPPDKRGMAMAIFGTGAMVGPAIGPIIGGYTIDNRSVGPSVDPARRAKRQRYFVRLHLPDLRNRVSCVVTLASVHKASKGAETPAAIGHQTPGPIGAARARAQVDRPA